MGDTTSKYSKFQFSTVMEKSKEEPHIIDYDSDSDEFSDAIDTHADLKGEDDFFDVPEWREEKAKTEDENELSDKDESETEASIEDLKDQKLKERIELEEKLSEEERLNRKKEAIDFKKTGNDLYL